jgi:hypothetical protein
MGGACSAHRKARNTYKILVRKPQRKRSLRRPKSRSEDDIKFDSGKQGWSGLYSYGSGLERVADSCEHGDEPSGSTSDGEFLDWLSVLLASLTLLPGVI